MAKCRSSLLYTPARVFTARFGHLPRGVRACGRVLLFRFDSRVGISPSDRDRA